jgi:DNA replication protein DnaC
VGATGNEFLRCCGSEQYVTHSTGCGKTGLATSFLVHAINKEYRGKFIDFKDLLGQLYASIADHSEKMVLKRFAAIDCLLIDEVGYSTLDKPRAGLFFDLMKMRHRKQCTIITSQLGFDEWGSFINDRHLTAAILDRITENCTVFNMSKCISLRQKKVTYATSKDEAQ